MSFKELMTACRSYRRFIQKDKPSLKELENVMDHVRLMSSPANIQPLKFILVSDESTCASLFPHLRWAAYLKDWDGPVEGERPAAYIIMLGDRRKSAFIDWDYGIALQVIMLSITEMGYGACAIAACDKKRIASLLDVPPEFELACVVALGRPGETVVVDEAKDGDIKYWRDEGGIHHVPKRSREELILKIID